MATVTDGDAKIRQDIGRRIKMRRAMLGISQDDLAKRLDVEQGYVSMWERGTRGLRIEQLIAVARILEISVGYLVGEEPGPRI